MYFKSVFFNNAEQKQTQAHTVFAFTRLDFFVSTAARVHLSVSFFFFLVSAVGVYPDLPPSAFNQNGKKLTHKGENEPNEREEGAAFGCTLHRNKMIMQGAILARRKISFKAGSTINLYLKHLKTRHPTA